MDAEVHEVKDHCRAVVDRQCGESKGHLGPWLRLYQIHSATLAEDPHCCWKTRAGLAWS